MRISDWSSDVCSSDLSERTVENREDALRLFIGWAHERGLTRPQEISKPILERYQRHLFLYRKANGEPLSTRSQHVRTTPIRALFKWLARQNHILYNPASDLELPRMEKRLPRHVRSEEHTSELQSLMRISYAGFCLKKKKHTISTL